MHWAAPRRVLLAAGIALLPFPLPAQELTSLDIGRAKAMLRTIHHELRRNYYDSTFHGIDLDARYEAARARMDSAGSNSQLFGLIASFMLALDDSHTSFWPPSRAADVSYGFALRMIGDSCYVTTVQAGSGAYAAGLRVGDRVLAVEGLAPRRRTIWQIEYALRWLNPRESVRMVVQHPGMEPQPLTIATRVTERRRIIDYTGRDGGADIWEAVRRGEDWEERAADEFVTLADTILVWRMPTFLKEDDRIEAGIVRARRHRALVLDLRGNSGGYERALLRLLGHVLEDEMIIGYRQRRTVRDTMVSRPRSPEYRAPMIVLIDGESASAAELFAHAVQTVGRARVIGDVSAGAVMRSRGYSYNIGTQRAVLYGASITDSDIIMADGTRLEQRGVRPDVVALPGAEDLARHRDPVMSRALAEFGLRLDPAAAARILPRRRLENW